MKVCGKKPVHKLWIVGTYIFFPRVDWRCNGRFHNLLCGCWSCMKWTGFTQKCFINLWICACSVFSNFPPSCIDSIPEDGCLYSDCSVCLMWFKVRHFDKSVSLGTWKITWAQIRRVQLIIQSWCLLSCQKWCVEEYSVMM